jgi:hypothetical protein
VNFPGDIVVTGGYVYYIEGGTNGNFGTVQRIPVSGGTPTTIISGLNQANGLVLDATNVYVISAGSGSTTGSILRAPLAGGTPTTILSGQQGNTLRGLAIDGTYAYFTYAFTAPGGSIARVPLTGGTPTTIVSGIAGPESIAVNGSCLYYASGSPGAILRVTK